MTSLQDIGILKAIMAKEELKLTMKSEDRANSGKTQSGNDLADPQSELTGLKSSICAFQ